MGPINQHLGGQALPGPGPEVVQQSNAFQVDEGHGIEIGIKIDADTDGEDNVGKEYLLLPGTVLVKVVAAGPLLGKYVDPGHASAPIAAAVTAAVILNQTVDLRSKLGDGTRADASGSGLIHGCVEEAKLFWGAADATYKTAVRAALKLVHFL